MIQTSAKKPWTMRSPDIFLIEFLSCAQIIEKKHLEKANDIFEFKFLKIESSKNLWNWKRDSCDCLTK